VFENRVLRRIFGPKRDEETGGWRKLHNEELHNMYPSPRVIRMISSRRIRQAGQVARTERRGMHIRYWWESQKENSHYEAHRTTGVSDFFPSSGVPGSRNTQFRKLDLFPFSGEGRRRHLLSWAP
jgi:hypothetical protein